MKTFIPRVADLGRKWYLVDVKDAILGRTAVKIANILRGKQKATFTPHLDCGDFVIVINARHVRLTGRKSEGKLYYRYTGYPGGLRKRTFSQLSARFPERVVETAVRGMIPHNRLGRKVIKKLHVYPDDYHPHQAQRPEKLDL